MQTTRQNIDSQRQIITYYSFAGIQSFAKDKKMEIYETPASYSVSIFKDKVRTELHIFYKP